MEHATILRTALVPIDSIQRHPKNARKANASVVENSLREFGQYTPVVVQESTGYILKGNNTHRIMAEKLGRTEIQVTYVSCSDKVATAILAVDNKSTDGAGYDDQALLALLEGLDADGMLGLTGFESDELDDLQAKLEEIETKILEEAEQDLLGESSPEPDSAPRVETASGIQPAKSLSELGKQYDQQATRMMLLNYPIKQFTYAVEQLGALGEKWDLDNNADVILKLIEDATGTAAPDAE